MKKELTENIFVCFCVEFITNVAITTCLHCFYGAEGGAWQHNERASSCHLMTTTDLSNKTFFLINNLCFHFDICKNLLIYFIFLKMTLVKGLLIGPNFPFLKERSHTRRSCFSDKESWTVSFLHLKSIKEWLETIGEWGWMGWVVITTGTFRLSQLESTLSVLTGCLWDLVLLSHIPSSLMISGYF